MGRESGVGRVILCILYSVYGTRDIFYGSVGGGVGVSLVLYRGEVIFFSKNGGGYTCNELSFLGVVV